MGAKAPARIAMGLAAILVTLSLLRVTTGAWAAPSATLTVAPSEPTPGETVTAVGTGFAPGEQVKIESKLGDSVVNTRFVEAGPDGGFSFQAQVLEIATPGLVVDIFATGQTSGRTAQTRITIVAPTPTATPTPTPRRCPTASATPPSGAAPRAYLPYLAGGTCLP
jgi:hypothetical protein